MNRIDFRYNYIVNCQTVKSASAEEQKIKGLVVPFLRSDSLGPVREIPMTYLIELLGIGTSKDEERQEEKDRLLQMWEHARAVIEEAHLINPEVYASVEEGLPELNLFFVKRDFIISSTVPALEEDDYRSIFGWKEHSFRCSICKKTGVVYAEGQGVRAFILKVVSNRQKQVVLACPKGEATVNLLQKGDKLLLKSWNSSMFILVT